jgi:hypothetical protein
MKRGLVEWDPSELSRETLAGRVAQCQAVLAERDLDAAVFYTSVAQPGLVRYLVHFLPYWNEGVVVLPREGEPTLFVALSNRVFPWIKGSSTLQDVRASRNLGADAARLLGERGATRVGLADRASIPYRVVQELAGNLAGGQVVDAAEVAASIRLGADADELRLRGRAAAIVAGALAEVGGAVGGRTDSAVAGQLDGAMRLAAAEDTLVLVGPAGRWPGLPTGITLSERAHVVIHAEYKGHWVMLGRTLGVSPDVAAAWQTRLQALCAPGRSVGEIVAEARAQDAADLYLYRSGRGAPFTALGEGDQIAADDIVAVLALRTADGGDLYGDTFAATAEGLRPLV